MFAGVKKRFIDWQAQYRRNMKPEENRVRVGERGGVFKTEQMSPDQGDNREMFELTQLRKKKSDAISWLLPMANKGNPRVAKALADLLAEEKALGEEIDSLSTAIYARAQMKGADRQ